MAKVAFLFPGQGSQYVGMGKEFLENYDLAKELFDKAQEASSVPVGDLCVNGPMEELTKTVNLQPCLTTVDVVCARALMNEGISPDATAGHSLGEYAALWACGALDFSDCIKAVRERGRLMEEAASQAPGAMAAIIGIERDKLQDLIDSLLEKENGVLAMANHNSREQIVVTGEKHLVSALCNRVKGIGKRAIMLKVSGAYHSPLMKDAAGRFGAVLKKMPFKSPLIPLYSNVSAEAENDPAVISGLMKEQMCCPVRWYEIVNNMYRDGVRIFIEAGPKKVLANLVRKSVEADDIKVLNVERPEDIAEVKKAISFN